jgi:hypothetical protein
MLERHRQQRIHSESELEGGLRDEQVGTGGHAGNDPQLGVRQVLSELPQDRTHCGSQVRHRIGAQITVPGNPNDEG